MAKKNTLKYVILGLLRQHDLTGYDIKKLFSCEIGDFWNSKHSQIYPELKKLEEEHLITSRMEISGKKLEKTYYMIKSAGIDALDKWLSDPLDEIQPTRDDFTLKLYFIDHRHDQRIKNLFSEEILRHQKKFDYLSARMGELFSSRENQEQNFGHYLILKKAILRENTQLKWLKDEYRSLKNN
ncbi:PadR family transcriptional regulator [Pectinatus haikarae]|uniref:DNA-binding PadR family transcriptional regulator n=1 Tax=Pectinatus haikarae TaxID=349096 RepID=A0ABT9Y794_9FIRM|nr:PadR family transcriptional regulator [Pectinatus haikarae]MDQ0203704.1 DNA-binding PadR family transcriptional regulator [Pectinatus haikarae]